MRDEEMRCVYCGGRVDPKGYEAPACEACGQAHRREIAFRQARLRALMHQQERASDE